MLESSNRSWNWIMDLCPHPLCCFTVVGWKMELIAEATPHSTETMLVFYLQIFDIYYMNSINLLCCLHKSTRYSSGMIQRHHFGKFYSIENLEAEELWWTHLNITRFTLCYFNSHQYYHTSHWHNWQIWLKYLIISEHGVINPIRIFQDFDSQDM